MKLKTKYFLTLLTAAFMLPHIGWALDDNSDSENGEDLHQPEIDSLINLIKPDSSDSFKARIYCEISGISINLDSCLKYAMLSLEHCKETDSLLIAHNFYHIGDVYFMKDEPRTSLQYRLNAADIFGKLDKKWEAKTFIVIGNCYNFLSISDSIFPYFNHALKYFIETKDTNQISYTYQVMGDVYHDMNLNSTADENYRKALEYATLSKDTLEMAYSYYLIGENLFAQSDTLSFQAIAMLKQSVSLFESKKHIDIYYIDGMFGAYSLLSEAYIKAAKLTGKNEYADSCYFYIKKVGNHNLTNGAIPNYILDRYIYVSYLVFYKKYNDALAELLNLGQYINDNSPDYSLKDYHNYLYEVYSHIGDYKNALAHYMKSVEYRFKTLNDSAFNSLKNAEVQRMRMLEELKLENAEKLHTAEKLRMRIIIFSLVGGLFLVSLLVFYVFRVLRIKHKANTELSAKNILLAEQKEEIQSQRDHIETQNQQIQSSINYARRIQSALLTPQEAIGSVFPDHFVLYNPRDVVSGDFYWVGQFGDNKVCIVADCTGHGVPGGFMSILGMTNLNYIVGQELQPDIILDKLRNAIIRSLRQNEGINEDITAQVLDGMDVAAYVVNERQMTLTFAGANNPLVLIRDNKVQMLKGDRMPVGIHFRIAPFKCTTIDIKHGDCIYTFSDGYQDQFADGTHNKFTAQRLRDLLLEIHQRPMNEQREVLNRTYEEWRGPAENQTDDVVIMGVRI